MSCQRGGFTCTRSCRIPGRGCLKSLPPSSLARNFSRGAGGCCKLLRTSRRSPVAKSRRMEKRRARAGCHRCHQPSLQPASVTPRTVSGHAGAAGVSGAFPTDAFNLQRAQLVPTPLGLGMLLLRRLMLSPQQQLSVGREGAAPGLGVTVAWASPGRAVGAAANPWWG